MHISIKQILLGLVVCGLLPAKYVLADERQSTPAEKSPPRAGSLDDELLKSLTDPPPKAGEKSTPMSDAKPTEKPVKRTDEPKSSNPLDDALRKSLADNPDNGGEDLGEDQITKVAREMRSVQERLAQSKSDGQTQAQQKQIAAELASLLEQFRKQCSGSKPGSKSGGNSSKPGGSQQGGTSPASDAANQPAHDSSPDVRPNRGDRPDPVATRDLLKKSPDWLKLPEKEREQMLQNSADEFLPNYEFAIKKYFERIIEDEK
jgi:hypothetical protein